MCVIIADIFSPKKKSLSPLFPLPNPVSCSVFEGWPHQKNRFISPQIVFVLSCFLPDMRPPRSLSTAVVLLFRGARALIPATPGEQSEDAVLPTSFLWTDYYFHFRRSVLLPTTLNLSLSRSLATSEKSPEGDRQRPRDDIRYPLRLPVDAPAPVRRLPSPPPARHVRRRHRPVAGGAGADVPVRRGGTPGNAGGGRGRLVEGRRGMLVDGDKLPRLLWLLRPGIAGRSMTSPPCCSPGRTNFRR
jgi:hypothetical protein